MKIVLADMSINQAKKFLKFNGIKDPVVLDYEFGYTVLKSMVHCICYDDDAVYLMNNPLILEEVRHHVNGDLEDPNKFGESVYILTNSCHLLSCWSHIGRADLSANDVVHALDNWNYCEGYPK